MSIDVSVIVPVYNSEKYLPKSVETLLGQTLRSVEFIFVDDGSTDRSLEILKNYQQQDDRITVLHQDHSFCGVARNTGMAAAKGKYITFPDSDDFFEPDMLESAFLCAEENRAEILIFGFNWYNHQTGAIRPYKGISSLPDCVFSFESSDGRLDEHFFEKCCPAAWNKLFLRSFIEKHGLRHQPLYKCTDTFFGLISLILAERIKCLDRNLVNYRVNNSSSLQGNMSLYRENYIDCMVSVKKKVTELNRYHGIVKAAVICYTIRLVRRGTQGQIQHEDYCRYYDYVKQHLIPDLFDAPEDFAQDEMVTDFWRSRDFEEYLFLRLTNTEKRLFETEKCLRKTESQLKRISASRTYRIGQAVKRHLRRVKHVFLRKAR